VHQSSVLVGKALLRRYRILVKLAIRSRQRRLLGFEINDPRIARQRCRRVFPRPDVQNG
jgi:hypothetical protein